MAVGRMEEESLYDVKRATKTYEKVLGAVPDHPDATEAVARLKKLATEWKRIVERFEEIVGRQIDGVV